MAGEINLNTGIPGLTGITASLVQSGTSVATGIALGSTATSGYYSGNMPAEAAGEYDVLYYWNGIQIPVSPAAHISWSGTAENTLGSVGGGGASATSIWQDLLSSTDFGTVGSVGALIKANLNAPVGSTALAATLATDQTALLAAIGTPTQGGTYSAPPTASVIAAAVWNTLTSTLTTANSAGLAFMNLITAVGSPLQTSGYTVPPTAAIIAAAVWNYLTASMTTASTIGLAFVSFLTGYTPAPTAAANRIEMDTNSTKLAAAATATTLATDLSTIDGNISSAVSTILTAISGISSGGGGNATVTGFTSDGVTALRAALATINIGVYSSTIQTPDGYLTTIVQGDDCLISNLHSLGNILCPDPSLVGTTAFMAIRIPGAADVVTAGVSVTSSNQIIQFQLAHSVTSTMKVGAGTSDVRFVDGSGNVSTWVVEGDVIVYPRIG